MTLLDQMLAGELANKVGEVCEAAIERHFKRLGILPTHAVVAKHGNIEQTELPLGGYERRLRWNGIVFCVITIKCDGNQFTVTAKDI